MEMVIASNESIEDDLESMEQVPDTGVLPPDHPMLARFQEALKEHLLKVTHQLENEITEIDYQIQKKDDEIAENGAKLFDLQQKIEVQNDQVDSYSKKILYVSDKRKIHEENVARLKAEYNDRDSSAKELKRMNNEAAKVITSMRVLESEISKWNEEIQNEIALAKRVANKDTIDQRLVSEEKKKMDLILFKLDSEVRKNDRELTNIEDQIQEHSESVAALTKNLSDANIDLEGLQHEHKKLMQAWGEIIVSVQHRDKILAKAKTELL